jgi:hypothetical protein
MQQINRLQEQGKMTWLGHERGWDARPEDVLTALSRQGFQECKREVAQRRDRNPMGGMWQGLDPLTGAVACVIWLNRPGIRRARVFIEIDEEPLTLGAQQPTLGRLGE